MTSAVVWCDFGGVLTDPIPGVLARFAETCGVPVDVLLAAFDAVAAELGTEELGPLECGALDEREWGRRVTAELAPAWTPRIDLTRFAFFWYAGRRFNHPLFDFLVAGRSKGLRLGLLTNSVREWEPFRAAMIPDRSAFDAVIRSHEIGVRKPDEKIFRIAEEEFGVRGAGCVLVDDSEVNCRAAMARGWIAIRHESNDRTFAALTEAVAELR